VIITKITLDGYRQHQELVKEFTGPVTAFIGENGTGKSHALDAIHFGLTGDLPNQKKEEMISWGREKGQVTVEFEHEGYEGKVSRALHKASASFSYRDTTCTGVRKVNEAVARCTGMDKELCRNGIFVRQAEIDAILFTTPADRQVAWQRLIGLADVPKIHVKFGQTVSALPEIQDYTITIAEGLERLNEMDQEMEDLENCLKITKSGSTGDMAALKARTDALRQLQGDIRGTARFSQDLATARDQVAAKTKTLTELSAVGLVNVQETDAKIANLAEKAANVSTYLRDAASHKKHKGVLDGLALPEEGAVEKVFAEVGELQIAVGEARTQLSILGSLAKAMEANPRSAVCILCDQPLDPSTDVLFRLTKKHELWDSKNVAATAELSGKSQQWTMLNNQAQEYAAKVAATTTMLEDAAKGMATMRDRIEGETTPAQLAQVSKVVGELKVARDHAVRVGQQLENAQADLASWQEHLTDVGARADAAIEKIQAAMAELGVTEPGSVGAALDEAGGAEAKAQEVQLELERLLGKQQQLAKGRARLQETLEDLKQRKAREADYVEALTTLRNARDWFHHSHGPKILIAKLLGEITRGVNDFLERFGSTFGVVADPDLMSFRYYYHDGRPMPDEFPPASELSGGEKIILAVSFRFASYCLFAGRVGLLSLDEPTVYLDDRNVGKFCQMMERVKEVATAMDLQIFLSTHERSVMPYADTLIDFGENTTV